MNKVLIILCLVLLTSCGPSQEEKERVAAVTCTIMAETREIDAAIRVEKMNEARDKIGGEPFLRGDYAIKEAFQWELCQELVLNEAYDENLQALKDAIRDRERIAAEKRAEENRVAAEKQRIAAEKQRIAAEKQRIAAEKRAEENRLAAEKQRIAAEKRAEENRVAAEKQRIAAAEKQRIAAEKQRIADSKPTVKEEFHSNGKLKSRTNYQPKTVGWKKDGLDERYYGNGQWWWRKNYKDGKLDGLYEYYYDNGQLRLKRNYKDGKRDGLYEEYHSNGQMNFKSCWDNGDFVDMSHCDQ
jgi:antitoxin component YwqK of YwqJK toxin-antitoxin module